MDRFKDILPKFKGEPLPTSSLPGSSEISRRYGVYHPDSLVPAPVKTPKDFDENIARGEVADLTEQVGIAFRNLPDIQTERSIVGRVQSLMDKYWDVTSVSPLWYKTLEQAHNSGGVESRALAIAHGWSVGASILVQEIADEQVRIAEKLAPPSEIDKYTRLYQLLGFPWSISTLRVGGLSLRDFIGYKPGKQSPTPFFRYLVEGTLISESGNLKEAYEENKQSPNDEFPHATMQHIDVLGNSVLSITNLSHAGFVFTRVAKGLGVPPVVHEIAARTKQICEKVSEVEKASHGLVLNPKTKDFAEMALAISEFLGRDDPLTDSRVFSALGLISTEKIIDFYRQTARLAIGENSGSGFYQLVNTRIDRMIEDLGSFMGVVTGDEASELIGESIIEGEEPKLPDLKKTVVEIFNQTRNPDTEIDRVGMDWSGLPKPDQVTLSFQPGLPMRFGSELVFGNDLGEKVSIRTRLDLARGIFDWNLKYDPMDLEALPPDVRTLRTALMIVTDRVLKQILGNETPVLSKESRQATTQKTKRERNQDPIYALRKEARAGVRESDKEVVNLEIASIEASFKNLIAFAQGQDLEDQLKRVSSVDAEIIREAIQEYNEKGTGGKFTRKKARGRDGEPRFTLSVGCTTPKGARVLLREVDSEIGVRVFEIEDIRYRKDIYRANKL